MNNLQPKEITCDKDFNNLNVASFGYNDGIAFVKDKGLQQTTDFNEMIKGTHFIVCCGDVMVKVESTDYPNIIRRTI